MTQATFSTMLPPSMPGSAAKWLKGQYDGLYHGLLNRPSAWVTVPVAIGLVAVATAVRFSIASYVTGGQFPTYFLAVILATLAGGVPVGILSLVLSAMSANFFLVRPAFSFKMGDPGDLAALAMFLVVASLMVSVSGALRSATAKAGVRHRQAIELEARARVGDEIRLWSEAFRNAAFGITVTDATTFIIRLANESAAATHGMRVEEMQGMNISDLYAPAERERLTALRAESDETGYLDFEADRLRRDGSTFPARVHISSVRGPNGEVLYHIGTAQDITSERRVAAELDRSRRLEAVGQLTAGVAHDFNNLLQAIMGHLELAIDPKAALPAAREHIATALSLADTGGNLTRQLLSFSGKQLLVPAAIDLSGFFEKFGAILSRALDPRIRVDLVVEPGLPSLWIDQSHLQSALLNLAINARDAMPIGGDLRVDVSCATPEAADNPKDANRPLIVIRVSDTGVGILPENQDKVCEPFFTTKGVNGTGLGLSMVYGFVRQSGGELRIASEVGRGTAVELRLPVEPRLSLPEIQSSGPRDAETV